MLSHEYTQNVKSWWMSLAARQPDVSLLCVCALLTEKAMKENALQFTDSICWEPAVPIRSLRGSLKSWLSG